MKDVKKFGEELRKMLAGPVMITPEDFQRTYGKVIDKIILDEERTSGREHSETK